MERNLLYSILLLFTLSTFAKDIPFSKLIHFYNEKRTDLLLDYLKEQGYKVGTKKKADSKSRATHKISASWYSNHTSNIRMVTIFETSNKIKGIQYKTLSQEDFNNCIDSMKKYGFKFKEKFETSMVYEKGTTLVSTDIEQMVIGGEKHDVWIFTFLESSLTQIIDK